MKSLPVPYREPLVKFFERLFEGINDGRHLAQVRRFRFIEDNFGNGRFLPSVAQVLAEIAVERLASVEVAWTRANRNNLRNAYRSETLDGILEDWGRGAFSDVPGCSSEAPGALHIDPRLAAYRDIAISDAARWCSFAGELVDHWNADARLLMEKFASFPIDFKRRKNASLLQSLVDMASEIGFKARTEVRGNSSVVLLEIVQADGCDSVFLSLVERRERGRKFFDWGLERWEVAEGAASPAVRISFDSVLWPFFGEYFDVSEDPLMSYKTLDLLCFFSAAANLDA